MANFPSINPSYGVTKSSKPKIRTIKFADGYEHRIIFGLAAHSNPKEYSLTFNNNSGNVWNKFNGNTGDHYRQTNYGVESAKYAYKYTSNDGALTAGHSYGSASNNDLSVCRYVIFDYTDTNKQKCMQGYSTKTYTSSGLTTAQNQMFGPFFGFGPYIYFESGGYYGDDAALTSLTLANSGGASNYFTHNSRINLYGLKSS